MTVNVEETIERNPFTRLQLLLSLMVSAAVIVDGFDIQAIAFVGPVLMKEWGLTRAELGPVIAAALIGMAIGAPFGGRFGDRRGRRPAMILSSAFFGIATLAAGFAENLQQLTLLRFISGLGFGALLPNATALIAEWIPSRLRSYAIGLMIIGVPLGGMLGAAVSPWLIASYGWRSTFAVGGVLGLVLALLLLLGLPESLRFLAQRPSGNLQIAKLLSRAFGGEFTPDRTYVTSAGAGTLEWREIFEPQHLRVTIGIAIAFFANLLVAYAFFNWVPTMLTSMGLALEVAIRGAFFYNLWGLAGAVIGAVLVARLGSKAGLLVVLAGAVVVTAVMGFRVQAGRVEQAVVMIGLSAAGTFVSGLQAALYALAANVYPTSCRSTGIGFAAGVGRLGPIASGFGGALVLSMPGGPGAFFTAVTGVLVIAAVGVLIVDRHTRPVDRDQTSLRTSASRT